MPVMNLLQQMARFFKAVIPIEATDALNFNEVVERVISARPVRPRSDRFWPSSINSPYGCDRKEALSRIERIFTDKTTDDVSKGRYGDIGTAIHSVVQDQYLGPSGVLFGRWRCPSCHRISPTMSVYPKGDYCQQWVTVQNTDPNTQERSLLVQEEKVSVACADFQKMAEADGRPAWLYAELRVFDQALNISGRVDGIILGPDKTWFTLELKTVSPNVFAGLQPETASVARYPFLANTPLAGATVLAPSRYQLPKNYHVTQASIYSELLIKDCEAGKIPLPASGYRGTFIVYVSRDSLEMRAFLRHNSSAVYAYAANTVRNIMRIVESADRTPRTDPQEEEARVHKNRTHAFQLVAGCSNRNDEKAKKCPWQLVCFPYKNTAKNKVEFLPHRSNHV